ncbi:phosphoglycerate mutase family protein [Aliiglaciecola litoralis]|uniref:Phosphoglycerate mutase family protein n=1 Tax=Aliiglaciecola litoralis TaxID=582857 RepID=A0ABP3X0L5_9ALTE
MKWLIRALFVLSFNAQGYELYLVRHFEKQADSKNPSLTEQGMARAQSLATLLADKDIQHIFSTDYKRTQQTAQPLSKQLGINITSYSPRDLNGFASQLLNTKQTSLIVGHSNTTPELLALLGGDAKPIAEDQYGELFILIVLLNTVTTQSVRVGNP